MKDGNKVVWIVLSEDVADFLAEKGEKVTFWDKKLLALPLEKRDDVVYRLLLPRPWLGVGLKFLRENPFVEIATIGDRRPTVPWWTRVREVMVPFFREKLWIIVHNEEADLSRYLRR